MKAVKSILGLAIRLYVGWEFLTAGLEKWETGFNGQKVAAFLKGGLAQTHDALLASKGPQAAAHANVTDTWAWLINHVFLPGSDVMAFLVKSGEVLVGVGLILGCFTFLAAAFAMLMNFSFMFTGTVSTNPVLLFWFVILFAIGASAYEIGIDRYLMPRLAKKFPILKGKFPSKFFKVKEEINEIADAAK